jgi:hypothetical protein
MPAFWFFVIVVGVVGTLTVLALSKMAVGPRIERLSRKDRLELDSLRNTIDSIDTLAYDSRELYPELSIQVLDEIKKHRRNINKPKELE